MTCLVVARATLIFFQKQFKLRCTLVLALNRDFGFTFQLKSLKFKFRSLADLKSNSYVLRLNNALCMSERCINVGLSATLQEATSLHSRGRCHQSSWRKWRWYELFWVQNQLNTAFFHSELGSNCCEILQDFTKDLTVQSQSKLYLKYLHRIKAILGDVVTMEAQWRPLSANVVK